jgi:acetyl esterase/lipase
MSRGGEDVAYADRLKAAGVPCHVEIVPGAFHAFDAVRPKAGVSAAGVRDVTSAITMLGPAHPATPKSTAD